MLGRILLPVLLGALLIPSSNGNIFKTSFLQHKNGEGIEKKHLFKPVMPTEDPLDGADHPCYRECVEGETMVCHYDFTLEQYHTMSKACFDCPRNLTDCESKDCIAADGVGKTLLVVNRKLPGPKIEVCQGDTIIVDLHNHLLGGGTTIHWHGHLQRRSPYMDGVPYVTQCPIPAHSTFRYKFFAENMGTHFWHSHAGIQRTEGQMGAMIVREPDSVHSDIFDYDLSEHIMVLIDWVHTSSTFMFTKNLNAGSDMHPNSLLVNGKGRFREFANGKMFYTPAPRFNVKQGFRYRFRLINAGILACPVEMSVVGHNISVISSDGFDVEPVEAVSLISYAGERFDFVIDADQEVDNYWIMFRGHLNCDNAHNSVKQVAVIHYEGAPDAEPEDAPTWEESYRDGVQVNPINRGPGSEDFVTMPELDSTGPDDISLKEEADVKFFIGFDFNSVNNHPFNRPPYGMQDVPQQFRTALPQFNHISMKVLDFPLLSQRDQLTPDMEFCDASTVSSECEKEYCACPHVLKIPLNSVVEIFMIDEGKVAQSNHPIHLHGYAFRVVGMERLGNRTTVAEVMELDAQGKIPRKLSKAPLKDTVTVPDGGYTLVRFYADNPGYWIYHCHIEFHAELGMALVFKVGEHEDFPPVPKGFPECGNYIPEDDE